MIIEALARPTPLTLARSYLLWPLPGLVRHDPCPIMVIEALARPARPDPCQVVSAVALSRPYLPRPLPGHGY